MYQLGILGVSVRYVRCIRYVRYVRCISYDT